jgi:hypothetical protein
MEERLTIVPERRALIAGSTDLIVRAAPKTWVSNSRRTASSSPFLDGRAVAVAGVVDEDVDCAEAFLGCGDRRGDLLVAGDVERNRESLVRTGVGEALDLGDVAGGGDDVVPAVERGLGEGSAESGGAAGDEPRRHGGSPSRRQI